MAAFGPQKPPATHDGRQAHQNTSVHAARSLKKKRGLAVAGRIRRSRRGGRCHIRGGWRGGSARGGRTKKGPRCCWTAAAGRHIRFLSPRAAATAAATPMRRPAREEQRGVPARLAARGGVMPSAFGVLAAGLVAHEPLVMRRSPSGTSEICVSTPAPVQGARALGSGTLQWACEGKL